MKRKKEDFFPSFLPLQSKNGLNYPRKTANFGLKPKLNLIQDCFYLRTKMFIQNERFDSLFDLKIAPAGFNLVIHQLQCKTRKTNNKETLTKCCFFELEKESLFFYENFMQNNGQNGNI